MAAGPPAAIRKPTIALALGGGGARGLAHIVLLETLDELGLRPTLIAGTSIGAIVGAAYASGLSGRVKRLERVGADAVAAVGGDASVRVFSLRGLLARPPRLELLAEAAEAKGERATTSAFG